MTSSLSPATTAQFDELCRHLEWSESFGLFFVLASPASGDAFRHRLQRHLEGSGKRLETVAVTPDSVMAALARFSPLGVGQTTGAGESGVVWVRANRAGAGTRDARRQFITRLNERREHLRATINGALIIEWPAQRSAELPSLAPDLWSVRNRVLRLHRALRWLHLSDLHIGARGTSAWITDVARILKDQLPPLFERRGGPPDLIMLTGDLAFSGRPEQYAALDGFLGHLDQLCGTTVPVVPVPGNHDVRWPKRPRGLRFLDDYKDGVDDTDVRDFKRELWERREAGDITPLFEPYQQWLRDSVVPRTAGSGVTLQLSDFFPGDLRATVALTDAPTLNVVGLNSAWLQWRAGAENEFRGRLELRLEQLLGVLPRDGSPYAPLASATNVLLMHHPRDWLSDNAREALTEQIYPRERFVACLCGHMHRAWSETVTDGAGQRQQFFQAPSLFGLEDYGTRHEQRLVGFVWGELGADESVRLWPFKLARRGGRFIFDADHFDADPKTGVVLRPGSGDAPSEPPREPAAMPTVATAPAPAQEDPIPPAARRRYLREVQLLHGTISLAGIGPDTVHEANLIPIEDIYTTVKGRRIGGAEPAGRGGPMAWMGEGLGASQPLAAFLPAAGARLLIEGLPGAGKSTFLKLVATMLARDGLARRLDAAREYLGLHDFAEVRVPVLLHAGRCLTALDLEPESGWHGVVTQLARQWSGTGLSAAHWAQLLRSGEVLLGIDGLDEISGDAGRERFMSLVQSLIGQWPNLAIVVCSRPYQTEALRHLLDFDTVTMAPFGDEEIRTFVALWQRTLERRGTAPRVSTIGGGESLMEAIETVPEVRRLAANPVMLVSLCVVHWFEGRLPQGRALLYQAVIRRLLMQRNNQRRAAGFTYALASEALALLAFAMMGGQAGNKHSAVGRAVVAQAVHPAFQRAFPGVATETLDARISQWLAFETTFSGIIETVAHNQVKFWHLTFQEFLAAHRLAWLPDPERWPVIQARARDPQWHETLRLLAPCVWRHGPEAVDALLERLTAAAEAGEDLAAQAGGFAVLERIRAPLDAVDYKPSPTLAERIKALRDRVLAVLVAPEVQAQSRWQDRLVLAEALGQAGDPRLDQPAFLPLPGTQIELARFPLTVQEFDTFVREGGYANRGYWDDAGWRIRKSQGWTEPDEWQEQLEHPNRPVVGVSGFEAVAYCRWRTAMDGPGGRLIRLPTDTEWAVAAEAGYEYPWGDEAPSPELANFGGNVGHPTPVGLYLRNAGPHGHLDLAGNVWEWTGDVLEGEAAEQARTEWDRLYEKYGNEVEKQLWAEHRLGDLFMVRGGAWLSPASDLAASRQSAFPAKDRLDFMGFRLAAASLGL